MIFCPKCGAIVNEKDKQCPKCHTNIVKNDVEALDLPKPSKDEKTSKIKEESKQTKNKEKNQQNKKNNPKEKIALNPIPLKVKKPTKAKHSKNQDILDYIDSRYSHLNKYYQNEDRLLNISSILKIFIVILLLVITVFIIISTAIESTKRPSVTVSSEIKNTGNIVGEWQTPNNSLFVFNEDSSFYWYESSDNLNNNYYAGTYKYKKAEEALEEMGYDEEEFNKTFGNEIKKENIYSVEISPTILYKDGQDVSTDNIEKNTKWWYILIIKQDGTAMSYNKTLDIRYNLIKK